MVCSAHQVEAFSPMGQLHIFVPDAAASNSNAYLINLSEYEYRTDAYAYYKMEFIKPAGFLKWYNSDGTWSVQLNDCVREFDVAPTPKNNTYTWMILLTDTHFYLKCNRELVAVLAVDVCNYKMWGGDSMVSMFKAMGGWELVDMQGYRVLFENMSKSPSSNLISCCSTF